MAWQIYRRSGAPIGEPVFSRDAAIAELACDPDAGWATNHETNETIDRKSLGLREPKTERAA